MEDHRTPSSSIVVLVTSTSGIITLDEAVETIFCVANVTDLALLIDGRRNEGPGPGSKAALRGRIAVQKYLLGVMHGTTSDAQSKICNRV